MKRGLVLVFVLFCSVHLFCQTITPAGPVNLCPGGSVILTASAGDSYQWQKDGTPIAGATGKTYTANATGSYTVIITTAGTPATSPAVSVKATTNPVPAFTTPPGSTCSGSPILFTSTVTGGTAPYTYSWAFGDGSTSTAQNPSQGITSLGCGNANIRNTLTVKDANGCTGSASGVVAIKQGPDVQLQDQNIFSQFSNCENSPTPNNPNYTLTINNISPSAGCVTSYSISWGDGSPLQTGLTGASFPLTHTYTQIGAFSLVISGTGTNGCTNSKTYHVANQSNPDIGIGTYGPTEGCSDLPVNIVITTWQGNSPGTTYLLQYGDGTTRQMTHPINPALTDDTTTHNYTTTSCPNALGYPLTITATNGCRSKTFTGGNIQVKIKPQADFTVLTDPACAGQSVCFSDKTTVGYYTNCAINTVYSWNFGDPASGAANTSTLPQPCHIFTRAGTYTVTLITSNPCGPSTITKQVCISDPAAPAFTLDNNVVCEGSTVKATNNSVTSACTNVAYQWTVSYAAGFCGTSSGWSFAAGSTATSANPSFIFTNPGTYTIQLAVTGSCGNAVAQKTVTVKKPPTVTLAPINNACGQATICPTATVTNCGTTAPTYSWEFDGGAAGTSTNANPGCITFSTPGLHTIKLSVTNECGTTVVSQQFSNSDPPDLTIPASATFCGDANTGSFAFSSTTPGAVITWTNNASGIGLAGNGSGNITAFAAINNTASPITATITVTATLNNCPTTKTFTITVNPKPAGPSFLTPINYCRNDAPVPLVATAGAGNTLLWYTSATGGTGSTTTPTPVTSTPGTTTWYVSEKNNNTGCESNRSAIVVNVSAIPAIGTTGIVNPSTCASGTGSILLNGLTPSTTYVVEYSKNGGVPITVSLVTNAAGTLTIPGLAAGTYSNITVRLNGCTSNMAGPLILADPNPPATPTATSDGPLCQGNTLHLTGTSPQNGVSYLWTGPDNFTSTEQNPIINNAQLINSGNYVLTTSLNGCTSQPAPVSVIVNARPLAPDAPTNLSVCLNDAIHLKASTTFTGPVNWLWTGPNGFTSTEQNPVIVNATTAMNGTYTVTATAITGNCTSPVAGTLVTVLPVPVISGSSFVNPVGCSSSTGAIILNGLQAFTTYTVQYVKDEGALVTVTVASNPDGSIIISGLQAGTYANVGVSLSGCISNIVGPFVLTDTPPFSVTAECNGPVCQNNTLLLTAKATAPGSATYAWTGPNGFTSAIQNPVINNATATDNGVYEVTITINGCSSKGTVTATVATSTTGGQTDADATACKDKNRGTINLTGYNGTVVRWESSVNNGISWSPVINTSPFLNYTNLSLTTWFRAVVQNTPCTIAYSDTTVITAVNSVQSTFFSPTEIITCNHDTTITFTGSVIYSGNDPVNYYWFIDGAVQGRSSTLTYRFRSALNNTQDERFTIRLLAENTAGCGDTSQPGSVVINALPVPHIQVSPAAIQKEPHFDFTFTDISPATPEKSYTWSMGDTSQLKSGSEVSYQYKKTGTYKVNLFVLDRTTTCKAYDSVYVTIIPVPASLYIPNAFYPNSAHPELRTFKLQGIGIKQYRLQIFDAWGKIVFETTELNPDGSPKVAWNGRYMNTGAPLPQDAYAWRVTEIILENGKKWEGMSYNGGPPKPFGNVTLFR